VIEIRWAVAGDEDELLALDRVSWDARSGFPSMQERDSFFTERSAPEELLVARHEGRIVGYLRLKDKYAFPEGAGVFGIFGLAVIPDARRLGVASALLEAAETEARRRGGRKIVLNVFGTNVGARRLYERHGYQMAGRSRAEFLVEGELVDDLAFEKHLSVT
jgi:ribosomal protein S18 acetylase RimI-like enzyme